MDLVDTSLEAGFLVMVVRNKWTRVAQSLGMRIVRWGQTLTCSGADTEASSRPILDPAFLFIPERKELHLKVVVKSGKL